MDDYVGISPCMHKFKAIALVGVLNSHFQAKLA